MVREIYLNTTESDLLQYFHNYFRLYQRWLKMVWKYVSDGKWIVKCVKGFKGKISFCTLCNTRYVYDLMNVFRLNHLSDHSPNLWDVLQIFVMKKYDGSDEGMIIITIISYANRTQRVSFSRTFPMLCWITVQSSLDNNTHY